MKDVKSWNDAAKTDSVSKYIHPAGNLGVHEYIMSGEKDANSFLSVCPANMKKTVLDFGCGNGRIKRHLEGQFKTVYGVDINSDVLMDAGENCCEIKDFNHKVDCIFALSVFIHLNKEEGKAAIKWMIEHLNPGGMLLLQIPLYEEAKEPGSWIDVGVWTKEMLTEFTESVGLKTITLHTSPGKFSFENVGINHRAYQVFSL